MHRVSGTVRGAARTYDEFICDGNPVLERNPGPMFLAIRRRQNNVLKFLYARIGPGDQGLLVVWNDGRLVFGVRHEDYG